ncbi:hypothetical protein WMY93_017146 [Mugilogobius chulae]|uniref:C2H2-type domain-containing protein n=1 Tax=Mugilogobius chulae TaxID=88201 RepID=A0AAW0NTT7_9GOBI
MEGSLYTRIKLTLKSNGLLSYICVKMAKNRKCILCETFHISRQEMEEHMRSMLHHRELENVKGRDCGHECRVCKVTMVSLTDYASHISSPKHKQNVEDFERIPARNVPEEEYFDNALVELIEKRHEQIRVTKYILWFAIMVFFINGNTERKRGSCRKARSRRRRAKEEGGVPAEIKRNKGAFSTRVATSVQLLWPQHGSWNRGYQYGTNPGHMHNVRPWQQSRGGKSSSWHAQDPPNYKTSTKFHLLGLVMQAAAMAFTDATTYPKCSTWGVLGVSKLDLPPVLKRDLTKHMISNKAKSAASLEPNLNIARRLISSSGSRRNVNWDQVYHEVRKKQDKGKGMPRFGIEMVPMDQEDHSQEEDDFTLLQGFHWDSLPDTQTPSTSRKRSLSESSIAPMQSHASFIENIVIKSEPLELQEIGIGLCSPEDHQRGAKMLQRQDSAFGESSSGTEMCDGQTTGKKRRATRDVPHPETSLEHHTKRRKIKSKKRSHIEELLAVSLREDELSRSLQSLDTDLIKARAALEAAFAQVQQLMMTKQMMTTEMGTLRNKRIELLKGMQDNAEEAPGQKRDNADPASSIHSVPLYESSLCASAPVMVKEEPRSPVHMESAVCAHSTTPELLSAASAPEAATCSVPSTESWSELCQRCPEPERDEFGDPVDSKESLADLVQSIEKGIQASQGDAKPSTNDKMLAPSWKDSEMGSFVESAPAPSFETPFLAPELNMSNCQSDLKSSKKVRKLKKRKLLKKAQSSEVPESSDTEMDTEATRPRCPRPRRRNSGGSQVSTSNLQTEEMEEEVEEMHVDKEDPQPSKSKKSSKGTVKSEPQRKTRGSVNLAQDPDSSKAEAQNVTCHEVSSTSDMDVSPAQESDVQVISTLPKEGKTSSDVSSDHGEDDLPTEGVFEGHVEAVNSIQIHDGLLYTCSGDRTVRAFDIVSHKCVGVFEGHSSKVNALVLSTNPSLAPRLYTGSSDQTIRCYSLTTQKFEEQFSVSDRVLCLHSRWKILFAGLANAQWSHSASRYHFVRFLIVIKRVTADHKYLLLSFCLQKNRQTDVFECHGPRAVSCLASSQEGARRLLLVGSYDSTISVRDAKNGLLLRTLEGHSKTVLCMKVVNDLVYSGSSDQCVYAHNIHSGQLVDIYKGHSHAVSVVCVLGKVMVTACLDKLIRVFDLQTQEQLQVYGGHKDMVMCMTVHKNMIYTGCYDGSVQATKLNLMQNYHCQWNGCSMVFGVFEHLEHHLTHNHSNPNLQTLRCRWKNCEEFFSGRISSKKAMLLHMQKHAAEESQVEP